eukprot:6441527-Ditylum_brightwellii.AAC.1
MMQNDPVTHIIMTQYHVSKRLKVFGKEGTNNVLGELKQLHERMVLDSKKPEELALEGKKKSLQCLMFLVKKGWGRIKGCGCADGRKQQSYIPKDDDSAPTVAIESIMLPCLIV